MDVKLCIMFVRPSVQAIQGVSQPSCAAQAICIVDDVHTLLMVRAFVACELCGINSYPGRWAESAQTEKEAEETCREACCVCEVEDPKCCEGLSPEP